MTSSWSFPGRAKSRMPPSRVLGEQQIVDLTATAGTYMTVAMLLAMAEETVPTGKEEPFKLGEP